MNQKVLEKLYNQLNLNKLLKNKFNQRVKKIQLLKMLRIKLKMLVNLQIKLNLHWKMLNRMLNKEIPLLMLLLILLIKKHLKLIIWQKKLRLPLL
jgi:hypothetical protein